MIHILKFKNAKDKIVFEESDDGQLIIKDVMPDGKEKAQEEEGQREPLLDKKDGGGE